MIMTSSDYDNIDGNMNIDNIVLLACLTKRPSLRFSLPIIERWQMVRSYLASHTQTTEINADRSVVTNLSPGLFLAQTHLCL